MKSYGSPTVRRRIIGSELRRLRQERGLSQQLVAEETDLTRNALSRYENAESSMLPVVAKILFTYYDVSGPELETLLELVKGSRKRGWLKELRDVVPEWFSEYICLEQDASHIKEFCLATIPGYLQTEDYAHHILSRGSSTSDIKENVKVRQTRNTYLRSDDAGDFHVILKETVLRTLVGGPAVMRAQLEWLLEQAELDNVTVQVLPEERGAHPSMTSPFTMLRFSEFPHFGIIYIDYLTGSLYRDEHNEVAQYDDAFTELSKLALSPKQSQNLIQTIAKGQDP